MSTHALRLDWRWIEGEARSLGALEVYVDDQPVWPTPTPPTDLEVFADDLLAFLVEVDPARAGVHNLAECFAGMYQLPPLLLRRTGPHLEIAAQQGTWCVPWTDSLAAFGHLGETLAQRLAEQPRFERLIAAWAHRRAGWCV